MQYLYYFANTSLVVRLLTYLSTHLSKQQTCHVSAVTVIYMVDRWVVRINLLEPLPPAQALNFKAFLNENGYPYQANLPVNNALNSLDRGMPVTAVMNKHHVVVVSHGTPQLEDIESFRTTFVSGLGYCPPSLV